MPGHSPGALFVQGFQGLNTWQQLQGNLPCVNGAVGEKNAQTPFLVQATPSLSVERSHIWLQLAGALSGLSPISRDELIYTDNDPASPVNDMHGFDTR